jgi:hypothetical protein
VTEVALVLADVLRIRPHALGCRRAGKRQARAEQGRCERRGMASRRGSLPLVHP